MTAWNGFQKNIEHGIDMKIRLLSDLHLEMPYNKAPRSKRPFKYEYAGEDVCVLAGDIHNMNRHGELLSYMSECPHVLMVAGNHEAYGQHWYEVHKAMKDLEKKYDNFKYLLNDSVYIDGVDFFGGTMFTSLKGDTPEEIYPRYIPDFSVISKPYLFDNLGTVWTTKDHKNAHEQFIESFNEWRLFAAPAGCQKRVVISHFVPTYQALAPQYANSELNPYFIEDMERYMTGIDLWLFGHTHTSFNFFIGDTRLVSNPYGYGDENSKEFIDKLIIGV